MADLDFSDVAVKETPDFSDVAQKEPAPEPPPTVKRKGAIRTRETDFSDIAEVETPAPKAYSITEGNVHFDSARPATGLKQAVEDGVIAKDWAETHQKNFEEAQNRFQDLQDAAGGASQAKAFIHGAGVGGAFLAGSIPGARIGAMVGTMAVGGPEDPLAAIAAPVGAAVGALATGTPAAWAARAGIQKAGEYNDFIKSFSAAAELHPVLDSAGELTAFATSAPKAIGNLVKLGRVASAGGESATKAVASQLAKGAAGGAAFEGIVRPAFDIGRYAVADVMGIKHDEFQAPSLVSLAQNVGLGILTAGHSVAFRDFSAPQITDLIIRGQAREDAQVPLNDDRPESIDRVKDALSTLNPNAPAETFEGTDLLKPMTPEEIAMYAKLKDAVEAFRASGKVGQEKITGATGRQAAVRGLFGRKIPISSAALTTEPIPRIEPKGELNAPNPVVEPQSNEPEHQGTDEVGQTPPKAGGSDRLPGAAGQPAASNAEVAEGKPGPILTPPLPPKHTAITIQRADGTTYPAAFGGYWQIPGKDPTPVISRVKDGLWSTGMLAQGEKIVGDVPPPPKPAALPETPKSSTQLTLPAQAAQPFVDFAKSIPDSAVYHKADESGQEDYGIETAPHITVLYGLTEHSPEKPGAIVATKSPLTVTLGKLSVFEGKDYDVLKVDVEGKDLHKLNAELAKLPNEQTHPDYHPHLTIAYLKKGAGKPYVGDTRFEGQKLTFNSVTFSPPKEVRATIGKPEMPFAQSNTSNEFSVLKARLAEAEAKGVKVAGIRQYVTDIEGGAKPGTWDQPTIADTLKALNMAIAEHERNPPKAEDTIKISRVGAGPDKGDYLASVTDGPNKGMVGQGKTEQAARRELQIKINIKGGSLRPTEGIPDNELRALITSDADMAAKAQTIKQLAKARGVTVKEMQEQVEFEVVRMADQIARDPVMEPRQKMVALMGIYRRQPVMSGRTSTSVELQAYSTPCPLAFAGGYAITVNPQTGMYEPTAGNGMLMIGSNLAASQGNELQTARADALRKFGVATVTGQDATKYTPSTKYSLVASNPPFGTIHVVNYDGFAIKKLEHLIALKALEAMADDGTAYMILGAKLEEGPQGKGAQWVFENYLYSRYNVVDNFEVAGELYAKQGAKWPVRVIFIDGRRKMPLAGELSPKTVERLNTWDDVWKRAERIRNEIETRRQALGTGGAPGLPVPPGTGGTPPNQPGGLPPVPTGTPGAATGTSKPRPSGSRKPAIRGGPASGGAAPSTGGTAPQPANVPKPAVQPGVGGNTPPRVEGGSGLPAGGTGNGSAGGAGGSAGVGPGVVPGSAAVTEGNLAALSDADIDALFDDAKGAPGAPAASGPPAPGNGTKSGGKAPPSIKDVGSDAVEGMGDIIQGLSDLFGGGGAMGGVFGIPPFNEKTYAKARPMFYEAFQKFKAAGRSLKELAEYLVKQLGDGVRQYFKKFVDELRALIAENKPITPEHFMWSNGEVTKPKAPPKVKNTELQVRYNPGAEAPPFETLSPRNIAIGEHESVAKLKAKVIADGFDSLDAFVANRLGIEKSHAMRVFAGEQIDGIAMAIDRIENGGALVIADQTGFGKGRQGAAVLWYSFKNDSLPVFITKDPKLFSDMWGDLKDIVGDQANSLRPFIMGDVKKARIVLPGSDAIIHRAPTKKVQDQEMARIRQVGMEGAGYNIIFATYSQVNERNARQEFLEHLANTGNMTVVLDEAHEAGGDKDASMQAAFISGGEVERKGKDDKVAVKVRAPGLLNLPGTKQGRGGVLYMSATFAKRPDNMPLYFRTMLSKAADGFQDVVDAMEAGGVALQQAVSEALAKAGEFLRRERDFTGVSYDMVHLQPENKDKLVEHVDDVTNVLSEIVRFSHELNAAIKEENSGLSGTALSQNALDMTEFAAIVHNQVGQLLLAVKADDVVKRVVDSFKAGEKPIVALTNTMESFLDHFTEDHRIKVGGPIKVRWNELLKHALSRTLRAKIKNPDGSTEVIAVNPANYGLQADYEAIVAMAEAIESRFPVSPIDYIIQKIAKAGYKMHELTGRTSGIEYTDFEKGEGIYRKFPKADKNTIINSFNAEDESGMLLNAAGSTGLSAHASVKVECQKPRHMQIVQPHLDINVFVQTLGRIFRTGMVLLGKDKDGKPYGAKYSHLVLPLQAELKPAAVAARKMKSLNANCTAEADAAIKIESVDFFNRYGDKIVTHFLDAHPEHQLGTGLMIDHTKDGEPKVQRDIARKFASRMALRPDFEQEQAYNEILPAYHELIEQLKATGDYDLEIMVHDDWDGKRLSDEELVHGTDPSNYLTSDVRVQQWEIKDNRPVPTGSQMMEEFTKRLSSPPDVADRWQKTMDTIAGAITSRREQLQRKLAEANAAAAAAKNDGERAAAEREAAVAQSNLTSLAQTENRWNTTRDQVSFIVGDAGRIVELTQTKTGDMFEGMLVDMKLPTNARSTASAFRFKFAIDAPGGVLYLTAADFIGDDAWAKDPSDKQLKDFTGRKQGQRYPRYFIVGNPIRGHKAAGGRGKVVRFRAQPTEGQEASEGDIITGLLMPNAWTPANLAQDPRLDLVNGAAAAHFLTHYGVDNRGTSVPINSADIVTIVKERGSSRSYAVSTGSSRSKGGKIYMNDQVKAITGDFTKVGNRMRANVDEHRLVQLIDVIQGITEQRFRPVGDRDTLMPQVSEANKRGTRQGDIEAPEATTEEQPTLETHSIEELRKALPTSGLSAKQQELLGAFLDTPLAKMLGPLTVKIQDAIEGGWQGSYFQRVAEIARNADDLTGPHEFLHAAWEILPDDLKAEFERMRVESLKQMAVDHPNLERQIAEITENPTSGGDDFQNRNVPLGLMPFDRILYPFSSAEEFFTNSASEQFKQKVGSQVEGFWAKVKQFLADFFGAIKRALKLRRSQTEIIDDILAGRFDPTVESGAEAERAESERQASLTPEQMGEQERMARDFEDNDEEGRPTQVLGQNFYVKERPHISAESIAASAVLAKQMFDDAKIPVTLKDMPDEEAGTHKGWIMDIQGKNMSIEGRLLLNRLRTEGSAAQSPDRLASIFISVRDNFKLGSNSSMSEMDPSVRLELFEATQSPVSAAAILLRSQRGHSRDIAYIGRNIDVELGKSYSDAMGGDLVRELLDEIARLGGDLGVANLTIEQLQKTLDDLLKKQGRGRVGDLGSSTRVGRKIIELIKGGQGRPWDILREIARSRGYKVPTDDELARVKAMADELDRLSTVSDQEMAEHGQTERDPAIREKQAVMDQRIQKLRKDIETQWKRWTEPMTLRTETGRVNFVNAAADWVSSNLLATPFFPFHLALDVGTLGFIHTAGRAIAEAQIRHHNEIAAGRRDKHDFAAFWKEAGTAITEAYKSVKVAIGPSLDATKAVLLGKEAGRNVARLQERISVFDRAMASAEEKQLAGRIVEANLIKLFTFMRVGYTVAQAFHNLQGVPAVAQEMRHWIITQLRRDFGCSAAEAETKADWIIGDYKAEFTRAYPDAQRWLEADSKKPSKSQVKIAAHRLVTARQVERMRGVGLPADAFNQRASDLVRTMGFMSKERGGLGEVVSGTTGLLQKAARNLASAPLAMAPVTMPAAMTLVTLSRFGNAMAILLNRKLTFTGLGYAPGFFGVRLTGPESNVDATGIARGGSPFFKYPEDRTQRKVESTVFLPLMLTMMGLAAAGIIRVLVKWPKDKLERERWEKNGWRPGQVLIPTGEDTYIKFSMHTGPFMPLAPGLSAGGALHDLFDSRAKQQAALNAKAEKLGVEAGKIKDLTAGDLLGTGLTAAWSALTSGRTASAIINSMTDYGSELNVTKAAASVVSAYMPFMPALQQIARQQPGAIMDSQMAGIWDYLMPLSTSGAAKVNMLGDHVGSDNAIQRLVENITGGNYPFPVNDKEREIATPYRVLFETGYRPPSINPNQGYLVGGEFRPLTKAELAEYSQKRGDYLKEELTELGDGATIQEARTAYQRANVMALGEIGVSTGSKGGSTPSKIKTAAAGSTQVSAQTLGGSPIPPKRVLGQNRRGVGGRKVGVSGRLGVRKPSFGVRRAGVRGLATRPGGAGRPRKSALRLR